MSSSRNAAASSIARTSTCASTPRFKRRRYAGVSHIDVTVHAATAGHDLEISALAYYPNNLHPDESHREQVNAHLRAVIDAAQRLGVPTVTTFVGNDKDRPLPDDLRRSPEIWPALVDHAAARRQARDRELPDDLQLRRMAGRKQPRLVAGDLG